MTNGPVPAPDKKTVAKAKEQKKSKDQNKKKNVK
jgi:hypothetical protein